MNSKNRLNRNVLNGLAQIAEQLKPDDRILNILTQISNQLNPDERALSLQRQSNNLTRIALVVSAVALIVSGFFGYTSANSNNQQHEIDSIRHLISVQNSALIDLDSIASNEHRLVLYLISLNDSAGRQISLQKQNKRILDSDVQERIRVAKQNWVESHKMFLSLAGYYLSTWSSSDELVPAYKYTREAHQKLDVFLSKFLGYFNEFKRNAILSDHVDEIPRIDIYISNIEKARFDLVDNEGITPLITKRIRFVLQYIIEDMGSVRPFPSKDKLDTLMQYELKRNFEDL